MSMASLLIGAIVAAGSLAGAGTPAAGADNPIVDNRMIAGGPASLVGCATRSIFFNDVYELSLFDGPGESEAIAMRVVHDGSLPGGLPKDWPPRLRESISQETIDEIDKAFGMIRPQSHVDIVYDAEQDRSLLMIDGDTAVSVPDATTYSAIRAMWFGEDPVSNRLKRRILAGECRAKDRDGQS